MATAGARRYARAIFELATDEHRVDEWRDRIEQVRELLAVPEIHAVLANPTVSSEQRESLIQDVAGPEMDGEAVNLAKLLVGSRRVDAAPDILGEYERLADAAAGRVRATATTAVELPAPDVERLVKDLSKQLGREVRLTVRVDPGIVGGLVLRIGDRVIDGSVATRLQQLRRRLALA